MNRNQLLDRYEEELEELSKTVALELNMISDRICFEQSERIIFQLIDALKLAKRVAEMENLANYL